MLFLLLIFYLPKIIEACPEGFIQLYRDNSTCYYFDNIKTDFIGAEGICLGLGGHLTSIYDMFENIFLAEKSVYNFTNSTLDDFWIGANNLITTGKWSWIDGTPFDFNDWDKGQPQNLSNNNCGTMTLNNGGKWKTDDCFKKKPFVCLVKIYPSKCSEGWTYFNYTDFCYKAISKNSTWFNAEMECVEEDSHLISIHSWQEVVFAMGLAAPYSYSCDWKGLTWIGLTDQSDNKNYQWIDGSLFDYNGFAPGQPTEIKLNNCGVLWTGEPCNQWYPAMFYPFDCKNYQPNFICKKAPVLTL